MMTTRRAVIAALLLGSVSLSGCASDRAQRGDDPPRLERNVLVFGGTGLLGAEIVRRLVASGDKVAVFARANSDRSALAGLPVSYVIGDLMEPDSIRKAFKDGDFDLVVNAVRVEDGDARFYEKSLGPMLQAASAARIDHFLHHGAVGAGDNVAKFTSLGWDKVPGLLDRLRDQGVGEQLIRQSGVPFTIIRNSRIYPDGTPSTGRASLTEDDSVLTPMTRADLAIFTTQCLGNVACFGRVYHINDPSLAWPPPQVQPQVQPQPQPSR